MEMEADRMVNLKLAEKEVATEREVIIEERRSRTENSPSSILSEQMSAALYQNHPYRIPIIGWMHEMAKLSREDALAFYKRFYAPNNAIVVVAGDVTVEEVKALAEAAYGALKPNPDIKTRQRPQEPPHRAARRVELKDPRAGNASVRRFYLAPSIPTAAAGRGRGALPADEDRRPTAAPAGSTRRWCRRRRSPPARAAGTRAPASTAAASASTRWRPRASTSTRSRPASTASCTSCARRASPTDELERAKKAFIAEFVYEFDSQSALARRYAEGMLLGLTIEQINDWPAAIAKVTAEDVKRAAAKHLDIRRSVTGRLIPTPPEPESDAALKPAADKLVRRTA